MVAGYLLHVSFRVGKSAQTKIRKVQPSQLGLSDRKLYTIFYEKVFTCIYGFVYFLHIAASRSSYMSHGRRTGGREKRLNINKFNSVGGKNHSANLSPMAGENTNIAPPSSDAQARFGLRTAERAITHDWQVSLEFRREVRPEICDT